MSALLSLVHRLARPAPTRPWWRRHPRALLSTLSVLLGLGIIAGTVGLGGGTAGAGVVCDPDQHLPAVMGGAERAALSVSSISREGHIYVKGTFNDDSYAPGQGLDFTSFAFDGCADMGPQARLGWAETVWQMMLQPLKLVASAVDWALSGHIAGALLGVVGTVTSALQGMIVARWLPAVICLVLLGAILKSARGRGNAFSQVAWMAAVLAGTAIIASPVGVDLATTANTYAAGIARCAALGTVGGNCDEPGADITSTFIDGLVGSTWAHGALGSLGSEPIPETLQWVEGGTPDVNQARTVTVPRDVIPAQTPGAPTWAEALRWTQAYSRAESSYLVSHPEAQCSVSGPTAGDVTSTDAAENVPPTELCAAKYELRVAILSDLHENDFEAYDVVRGMSSLPSDAAWSLAWLIPGLAILAFLAVAALVAEAKLLAYLVITPVMGLLALKEPTVAREWGQKIAATFWARILAGLTFGVAAFLIQQVIKLVNGETEGGPDVPVPMRALVISLLAIVSAVVAFQIRREVAGVLDRTMGAGGQISAHADGGTEAVKKLATGAAGSVGGALAGGALAGKGNRVAGMMRGGMRGSMARGPAAGAFLGGEAGRQVREREERRDERAQDRALRRDEVNARATAAQALAGTSPAEQQTAQALRGLLDAPEIRQAQQRAVAAAEALAKAARAAAQASERELQARERSLTDQVRGGLVTPVEAEQRLAPERERHEEVRLTSVRAEADLGAAQQDLPPLAQELAEAIRRGATAVQLTANTNATPQLVEALTEYEAAIRLERRLRFSD